MKRIKTFLINGFIITLTTLVLRGVSVFFNAYLSNNLGAEGMGLYSLVSSVFGFGVTFASSGINLGTTRLVSEALANNRGREIRKALWRCTIYSLAFSTVAFIVLFSFSDIIGEKLLGDIRTVRSLRILSASLPFISLSSVLNGYFMAVRRAYKSASVMILEQFVNISVTVKLLSFFVTKDIEYACIAVAVGTLAAEVLSLCYNALLFAYDKKKHIASDGRVKKDLTKRLLSISLPLALSTYIRSGLVTLEHLLIPYGLRKSGAPYSQSLSSYGLIHGMVFPIIMYPSCFIYTFSGLLVPEIAGCMEKNEKKKIDDIISKVLRYSLIFSVGVSGIMICFAYEISMLFYHSPEAYPYIRLFAPLISVMYLDGAVDGLLKGLDQQLYSMKVNIADAALSVLLVYTLIPRFAVKGYIIAVFACEIFNCGLSLTRLIKISQPSYSLYKCVIKPVIAIVISTTAVTLLFDFLNITYLGRGINLLLRIIAVIAIYLILVTKGEKKEVHQI